MEKTKFRYMGMSDKIFTVTNYAVLTAIFLIVLYPILYVVSASFSSPQAVISGKVLLFPVEPTLRGYQAVFQNAKILTGFANSIFYLVAGTAVNIIMTILCAYPLSRKEFRARGAIAMFFIFTMYFSGGIVPSYILVKSLHIMDTRWAMIIPTAMSTYNMIICRTYIVNSIPDELYEASQMDGCTPFKYMIRVIMPLSKPIIAVLVLYYGVAKWNDYFNAILYLYKEGLKPLTIVMKEILIQKHLVKGVMVGAVKG